MSISQILYYYSISLKSFMVVNEWFLKAPSPMKDKIYSSLIVIVIKISKHERIELEFVSSPLSRKFIAIFICNSPIITKLSEKFAVKKAFSKRIIYLKWTVSWKRMFFTCNNRLNLFDCLCKQWWLLAIFHSFFTTFICLLDIFSSVFIPSLFLSASLC